MKKILFFTGAGISKPSGIDTFRDSEGKALWDNYDVNKVCNIKTWFKNKQLVHEFYNLRRTELKNVEPNDAHLLIAKLQTEFGDRILNVTQNIDDLFERAGVKDVLHVHGNLRELVCRKCDLITDVEHNKVDTNISCQCGSEAVKPNVVFFHEKAPLYEKMDKIVNSMSNEDLVVVIGTSGNVVPYGRMIGERRKGINMLNVLDDPDGWIANAGHLHFQTIDFMSADDFMRRRYQEMVEFLNN